MAIQKYPVGLQDFREIISKDYVYVDKTKYIHQLLTTYKYYFLSRPRRFGKSLFISTLDYLFKSEKELFKGLYIYDRWEFETHPVIRVSFSDIGYRTKGLLDAINDKMDEIASLYDVELMSKDKKIDAKFRELIMTLHQKYQQQVVVLIDEYDKPIIDYLDQENLPLAIDNKSILKSFYSILKDADPHLKMVFITGISKFSQISIFSDLNNLYDITLSSAYNEICGIGQTELECYFPKELKLYDKAKIKEWYNGYRWDIKCDTVYNPFSILRFFGDGGKFQNFWFSTGTPTFLIEMSKEQKFYNLENITANSLLLSSFDIENLEPIPILFQAGYLTIKSYQENMDRYTLDYPNEEVKSSFLQYLTRSYIHGSLKQAYSLPYDVLDSLQEKDAEKLQRSINSAFEHIPYDLWQKDNEHFYHAIVHLIFSLLGVYIQSEVHSKHGRADAVIHLENEVFCFEFKLDKSAEEALEQIRTKGYLKTQQQQGKRCYAIGVNFSKANKAIESLLWEEYK